MLAWREFLSRGRDQVENGGRQSGGSCRDLLCDVACNLHYRLRRCQSKQPRPPLRSAKTPAVAGTSAFAGTPSLRRQLSHRRHRCPRLRPRPIPIRQLSVASCPARAQELRPPPRQPFQTTLRPFPLRAATARRRSVRPERCQQSAIGTCGSLRRCFRPW